MNALNEEVERKRMLEEFFCNHLDFNKQCELKMGYINQDEAGEVLVDMVGKSSVSDILQLVRLSTYKKNITSSNIPQFSNYNDIDNVISIFIDSGMSGLTCKKLGYYLDGKNKSESAQSKYGENHYKLTMLLGLASENGERSINAFGLAYMKILSEKEKREVKAKLILRIPVIQEILLLAEKGTVNATEVMRPYLAESTIVRRKSSIKRLLVELMNVCEYETIAKINNIVWE